MIKIELTIEQANTLLQLVEIAMKAGNINNVKAGLPLYDLILDAAKESQSPSVQHFQTPPAAN